MDLTEPHLSQLWVAFGLGIGTSLTPCVYPLIPVTLALFGASKETSRLKSFSLSLAYVIGIALTYTSLGLIAAYTGTVFGSTLQNPYVLFAFSGMLLILSLYMLDLVPLSFVQKIQNRVSRIERTGYTGAFLMGAVSGLVAAPCTGPALVAILSVATTSQQPYWGAALLFCYALGIGMIFLVLGTFSGMIHALPRSGNWLHYPKFVLAAFLLTVALYLLQPFLPKPPHFSPLSLFISLPLAFSIAVVGFRRDNKGLVVIAALVLSVLLYLIIVAPQHPASGPIPSSGAAKQGPAELTWQSNLQAALDLGKKDNRIVIVDLYADWCAACKELDRITFRRRDVIEQLSTFALGRIDFTLPSEATDEITSRYEVVGLPCILFLRSDGTEIPDSRITGYLNPEEFLNHLNQIGPKEKTM